VAAAAEHALCAAGAAQDDANEYDGDHMILPEGGYGALLAKLAEGLDIRTRCTVKGIHYDSEGVKLDTSAGVIRGDAVVCTLPLGVLQLTADKGGVHFSPPLPPAKQLAISRLGFGVLNKVALFFDAPFWQHNTDFFGRVVPNPKHRGRFFLFFNLHPASGNPVLLALAAGAAAAELEELTDDAVTSQAVAALGSMFGENVVPRPVRTVVTRWGADRFARGSYSYVHVGASGSDYATLGEPVGERLFFAGEHTIMEHPATVVGAYLSGLRAGRALHAKVSGKIRHKKKRSDEQTDADADARERRLSEFEQQHIGRTKQPSSSRSHKKSHKKGASGVSHKKGASGVSHKKGASGVSHKKGASGVSHKKGASGATPRAAPAHTAAAGPSAPPPPPPRERPSPNDRSKSKAAAEPSLAAKPSAAPAAAHGVGSVLGKRPANGGGRGAKRPKRGGDSGLSLRRIKGGLGVLERAAARAAALDLND
jgi:hypothetical protein